MKVKTYLEITIVISPEKRAEAAMVYNHYLQPFLDTIDGALTKYLLIRDKDVQVLQGFDSIEHAKRHI